MLTSSANACGEFAKSARAAPRSFLYRMARERCHRSAIAQFGWMVDGSEKSAMHVRSPENTITTSMCEFPEGSAGWSNWSWRRTAHRRLVCRRFRSALRAPQDGPRWLRTAMDRQPNSKRAPQMTRQAPKAYRAAAATWFRSFAAAQY